MSPRDVSRRPPGASTTSDSAVILAILVGTIVLFVWGRFPVMLVALASGLSLWFTGLRTLEQTFAGFGDPVILFIAGLFVVAGGLQATGVTAWVGQWLSGMVGDSPLRLSVMTTGIVALLSPLISMNGAVAAITPVAILLALRLGQAPSKYLIPLAFASGAGSKLALTGTPKNVLVADASAEAGYGGFAFFEFALVGLPLLFGTVFVCALLGRRLLPERRPESLPADFSRHAQTLVEQYGLSSGAMRLRVRPESPLAGAGRAGLATPEGLTLVSAADAAGAPLRRPTFEPGDVLVVRGPADAAAAFANEARLAVANEGEGSVADTLFNRNAGLAEVVVPARSPLVGMFVFTAVLGQVISNTATALILIPIAMAASAEFGISPQGVLMSLNVGAAAAFLTPVATAPNLIVMGPGGYRFGDYWRLGGVLMLVYGLIAIFWVPLLWPLTPVA